MVVRESAPITTHPLNCTAMIDVWTHTSAFLNIELETRINRIPRGLPRPSSTVGYRPA